VGVKAEFNAEFLIEVDKFLCLATVLALNRILPPHFVDERNLATRQLDLLAMTLKVLANRLLHVWLLQQLPVHDVANVIKDHFKLTDWRTLNKVLHDLALDTAHIFI
jgi:hypothetical protein